MVINQWLVVRKAKNVLFTFLFTAYCLLITKFITAYGLKA